MQSFPIILGDLDTKVAETGDRHKCPVHDGLEAAPRIPGIECLGRSAGQQRQIQRKDFSRVSKREVFGASAIPNVAHGLAVGDQTLPVDWMVAVVDRGEEFLQRAVCRFIRAAIATGFELADLYRQRLVARQEKFGRRRMNPVATKR